MAGRFPFLKGLILMFIHKKIFLFFVTFREVLGKKPQVGVVEAVKRQAPRRRLACGTPPRDTSRRDTPHPEGKRPPSMPRVVTAGMRHQRQIEVITFWLGLLYCCYSCRLVSELVQHEL